MTNLFSQRTAIEGVHAFFAQNEVLDVDEWVITFNDDSVLVSRNDKTKVSYWANGNWVFIRATSDSLNDLDSVRVLSDKHIQYDVEYTFAITALNGSGEVTSDSIRVYYIVSDINGDYTVDGLDLIILAQNWTRTGLKYNDWFDITGDGVVDGLDLIQLAKDFTRTYVHNQSY